MKLTQEHGSNYRPILVRIDRYIPVLADTDLILPANRPRSHLGKKKNPKLLEFIG